MLATNSTKQNSRISRTNISHTLEGGDMLLQDKIAQVIMVLNIYKLQPNLRQRSSILNGRKKLETN